MSDSTSASAASPRETSAALAFHRTLPKATRERALRDHGDLLHRRHDVHVVGVHVPTVRDKFSLSPGMLSFSLLAVAGGSIFAMLVNGAWIARVGTRNACLAGGMAMIFGALILVTPWYWLLLVVLACLGVHGDVEEALARPIMSSLHGMFSIGGMADAAAGGALLALASVMSLLILLVSMPAVLPHVPHYDEHAKASSSNRWRSLALWTLGGLALIAEGAMYDWATVYMRDVVRARFGAPKLVFGSAGLAFAGMMLALMFPYATLCHCHDDRLYADVLRPRQHDARAVRGGRTCRGRIGGGRPRAGRGARVLSGCCSVPCIVITIIEPRILRRWKI